MSSLARNPVTAAFAPLVSVRTWAGVAYLALGFAIGIGEFVFLVTGLAVGFGLSIVIVGIPLLLAVVTASRALGAMDRSLANLLLAAKIETPPAHRHAEGPLLQRLRAVVMAPSTWRSLGWLMLRFPLSLVSFVVPVAMLGAAVGAGARAAGRRAAGRGRAATHRVLRCRRRPRVPGAQRRRRLRGHPPHPRRRAAGPVEQ